MKLSYFCLFWSHARVRFKETTAAVSSKNCTAYLVLSSSLARFNPLVQENPQNLDTNDTKNYKNWKVLIFSELRGKFEAFFFRKLHLFLQKSFLDYNFFPYWLFLQSKPRSLFYWKTAFICFKKHPGQEIFPCWAFFSFLSHEGYRNFNKNFSKMLKCLYFWIVRQFQSQFAAIF